MVVYKDTRYTAFCNMWNSLAFDWHLTWDVLTTVYNSVSGHFFYESVWYNTLGGGGLEKVGKSVRTVETKWEECEKGLGGDKKKCDHIIWTLHM